MTDLAIYILLGIVVLTLLLIISLLALVVYSGLVYPVIVGAGRPPIGSVTIAYKFRQGPYREAGALWGELRAVVPDRKCLGIYYDDPAQVRPEKLRYVVGTIVTNTPEDQPVLQKMEKLGFKLFKLPEVSNVVKTKFPLRTQISILLAVWRVYPVLGEYIKAKKLCAYPWIEYCDKGWMHFMAPLAKQEEFFVPETQLASRDVTPETEEGDSMQAHSLYSMEASMADEPNQGTKTVLHGAEEASLQKKDKGKSETPSQASSQIHTAPGGSTSAPAMESEKERESRTPVEAGAASPSSEGQDNNMSGSFVLLDAENGK